MQREWWTDQGEERVRDDREDETEMGERSRQREKEREEEIE